MCQLGDTTSRCRKIGYPTRNAAEKAMRRARASLRFLGKSATAYECRTCGRWHWGHSNPADKAIAMATQAHRQAKWPPRPCRKRIS